MVCANCGSESHHAGQPFALIIVRCAHNPGIGKKEARVHSEYAAFAMKPAIPRANAHRKVSAYATRATTVHISSEITLATKCANVARNTGTMRRAVRNHDAKRAAAQRTKARLASSALNTSARNAKARSIRKGTIETIALYRSPLFARSARKSDTKRIDAQRDRVLHVAFERTDYRHIKRVLSTYAPHAKKRDTIAAIARPLNATHAVRLGTYRTYLLRLNSTPEYLHALNPKDVPPHTLRIGKGDIVFLMRNLNKKLRLTNNTRLEVLSVGTKYVTVQTLGTRREVHHIPRISFTFRMNSRSPIVVTRLQFPLRLAYAITFNKAQGQTLEKVLIDGRTRKHRIHESHGAFTHGHLNVALSRVKTRHALAILVDKHNLVENAITKEMDALTANVVYSSIIHA